MKDLRNLILRTASLILTLYIAFSTGNCVAMDHNTDHKDELDSGIGTQAVISFSNQAAQDVPGSSKVKITLQKGNHFQNVEVQYQPIRPDDSRPRFPKPKLRVLHDGYRMPYGNTQQNSRIPFPLASTEWEVKWQVDLIPNWPPRYVLSGKDRVLVQAGTWQLFDLEGKLLASDRRTNGQVWLDTNDEHFYCFDYNANFTAYHMSDGSKYFNLFVDYTGGVFPLMVRRGRRIVLADYEASKHPHGYPPPSESSIQVIGLGSPMKIDANAFVSKVDFGILRFDSPVLRTAAFSDVKFEILDRIMSWKKKSVKLVAALPDRLLFVDTLPEPKIARAFLGNFTPITLSLDELNRAHIIAEVDRNKVLMVISPKGSLELYVRLPEEMEAGIYEYHPPIVGYDYSIYLVAGDRILALNGEGKKLWYHDLSEHHAYHKPWQIPGNIPVFAGAVVTRDRKLLVSEGRQVVFYNLDGSRVRLIEFSDRRLLTPPVLTASSQLLVASKTRLYCLEPRNK